MANKGLKKYNSFVDFSVGGLTIKINLSSVNKDLFILSPLTLQIGRMPLDISILYSHNNQNEVEFFGKGIRSSLYKEIEETNNNYWTVYNNDFSVDKYDKIDVYNCWNKEEGLKILKEISGYDYVYKLYDKEGNIIEYNDNSDNYFKYIDIKGKAYYSINYLVNQIVYKNYFNDSLTLNLSNGRVSSGFYRDSGSTDILFETDLSYDNQNRLINFILKKGTENLRSETINYGSNSYEIIDNISGNKIVVTINSSTTIVEEYFLTNLIGTTTITYYDNKTKMVNNLGQETIHLFDSEGIEITTINDNMAKGIVYHKNIKKPTFVSNEFRIKNIDNSIFIPQLSLFQASGVFKSRYTGSIDSDLANIVTDRYEISQNGYIYLDKNQEGTSNDYLTFLVWAKELSLGSNPEFSISITINGETETTKVNKLDVLDNYRLISVGIRPLKSYTSLRLKISVTNCDLVVGGLQLLKKGFGVSYEYDNSTNLIKVKDKLGTKEYDYNSENRLDEALDYRGSVKKYEYNQDGQIEYIQSRFGLIEKNEYDASNKYNLIKKKYYTISESIETEYTYNNNKDLTKIKDEFLNETSYGYDVFKNVSSILRQNIDLLEYNYNNYNYLERIKRNPSSNNDIEDLTYDSYRRISNVNTPSNSNYSFIYDNYNNVTNVKFNNINLLAFTYDQNQMLIGITYPNGDNYSITYSTNYKTISNIKINNQITYSYTYDDELKLIGISNTNIEKLFEYDFENRIKNQKIQIPNNNLTNQLNIDYGYLHDELKLRVRKMNGTFAESFNSKNTNSGSNPSILENYVKRNSNIFIASYNNPILRNNSYYYYYAAVKENDTVIPVVENSNSELDILSRVGEINAINMITGSQLISYNCHKNSPQGNRITIGMWIKANQNNSNYIFSIRKEGSGNKAIYAKFENNKIKLTISISGTEYNLLQSNETLETNKWYFIAYNYYEDYYEDEEESYDVYCHELYVGRYKKTFYSSHSDYEITSFSNIKYFIGYKKDINSFSNKFIGYITGIIMSDGSNVSEEFIKDYYKVSYEKLINNKVDYNSIEYSNSTYYLENINYNILDKIPLRGFFESFNGKRPKYYDTKKLDNEYIEECFTFDKLKGTYAYSPNSLLVYDYNLGNSGSIILNFKTYDGYTVEEIVEINNQDTTIGLYINRNELYVVFLGVIYSTNITVTNNTWHKVGLSYLYNGTTMYLDVYYDNLEENYSRNINSFNTNIDLVIGSSYQNVNISNIFFGQIMDVLVTNTYISQNDFNTITNSNYGVSKSEYYDSFGRIKKEIINYNGYEALINAYTYDKTRIVSEYLSGNSRIYSYNGRNYISSITDSTYGNHVYTYDERGYLASDNNTSYTYDGNGNILTAGSLTYVYDSTYKDRLNSVGGQTINYYSNNPYYPQSFDNMSFIYEGKRLKTVTTSSKTITYYYDDEGIRYKKEIVENNITRTTLYYYDNHKLITEIVDGVRRDYMYDSRGNVYGYVLAGASYYYIKDSIGIIHGIKSASNQVLATYTYDAYGNIISQNDTTTNHIKYKGYYYDEEIGMYYLLSRYYYPYWKRFLTPDNYTYLDLEDISEINLFAYCNNNPVMYSDGEGTFAISTLIIGAVIGAVVSTTLSYGSDVISNFKDGFEWSDFNTFGDNWQKYVCSAVGGAVSGVFGTFGSVGMSFIGGFAGSMIDSAYTFTSAENVGYALWTSLLAGSLAGIGTAVTNKITSSYFKSQLSNASSKTQHQISVFLNNSKKVPGVNTKAYSILSKTVNVNKIAGSVMGVIVDLLGLFY